MGKYLEEILGTGVCPSCQRSRPDIDEQFSFGVYAGVMCGECAYRKYRDHCGLGPQGRQGRAEDLDEPLEEE